MKTVAWSHVCCPVDFSPESRAALTVAVDLCRRLGARLTILHVEEPAAPPAVPAAAQSAAWSQDAAGAGVKVSSEATQGDPETAIAAWAERAGADAIVMGTHGRTGRAHALVGSVAESTVRNARCPVMVVHADWAGVA
jgi:nucleotide-binding universal stress UspA family protein